jgi:uncharacterized protein YcbK (DUF882 family)
MFVVDWSVYQNFVEDEFRCRCGCGVCKMDLDFVNGLQWLRTRLVWPFIINSAYRCPDYNDRIGNTGRTGPHTTGMAVDVKVSGDKAYVLVCEAMKYLEVNERGVHVFGGIGVSQKSGGPVEEKFIHLDMLGKNWPRPRVWSY